MFALFFPKHVFLIFRHDISCLPYIYVWPTMLGNAAWQHASFYKQRVFSTQPQCWLTFSWTELQMLLRCCLIHISIIILRCFTYLRYMCLCLHLGLFMLCLCESIFIFIFIFIMINCIISWMQTCLLFCLFFRIGPVIVRW